MPSVSVLCIHAFKFSSAQEIRTSNAALPSEVEKYVLIRDDTFRIIYVGGVFVFSQSDGIKSTETDGRSQILPSDCYWMPHSRKFTIANGDV